MKDEVKRLAGKLSYQGKALQRRIVNQNRNVALAQDLEQECKKKYLESQLHTMWTQAELKELFEVYEVTQSLKVSKNV